MKRYETIHRLSASHTKQSNWFSSVQSPKGFKGVISYFQWTCVLKCQEQAFVERLTGKRQLGS